MLARFLISSIARKHTHVLVSLLRAKVRHLGRSSPRVPDNDIIEIRALYCKQSLGSGLDGNVALDLLVDAIDFLANLDVRSALCRLGFGDFVLECCAFEAGDGDVFNLLVSRVSI